MVDKPIVLHGVQCFVMDKGHIAEGRSLECKGATEACRIAEERVRSGKAIGAAAFSRTIADQDYEDTSEPITLAIFGRVPSGLSEQLPF